MFVCCTLYQHSGIDAGITFKSFLTVLALSVEVKVGVWPGTVTF